MTNKFENSIYWVEVEKIKPNPFQPRRAISPASLESLTESIRQYGILQPLVVTRQEVARDDGGLAVEYELIAGERRWRAARLAGLRQVPAIIREMEAGEDADKVKLELAIIENLQREDLNPIDRAVAFDRLVKEFKYKHGHIAVKVGKSREYVSNSIRLLKLPAEMMDALSQGKISEGHSRVLLMLEGKAEEQKALFEKITVERLTVRQAETHARRRAVERIRVGSPAQPEIMELEEKLSEILGTRVRIESDEDGGRITIDYFSAGDLKALLERLSDAPAPASPSSESVNPAEVGLEQKVQEEPVEAIEQSQEEEDDDSGLYSVSNFTI